MRLLELEVDTIKLIGSIPQICRKPIQLWSTGKDSTTLLYLTWKTFGRVPWSVIHIDTGKKPDEVYKFRDEVAKKWKIPLEVIKNEAALELGISPDNSSRFDCCTMLKTEALKQRIMASKNDAVILAIRYDEHYVRGMEDLISLRDEEGHWQYTARFGGFGLVAPEQEKYNHIRINPLLPWTESEVWQYVKLKNLPVNPLYFSINGKRYRSLGCEPCTAPVDSKASTIDEIVSEVWETPGLERSGRQQDKESPHAMLKLRGLGYM